MRKAIIRYTRLVLVIAAIGNAYYTRPAAAGNDLVGKNMVGVRLGPWLAEGLTTGIQTTQVKVVSSSTAFHLELFYEYHLSGPLFLDMNFGAVSRGDIRIETGSASARFSAIGTAGIFPLGIGLQVSPLAGRSEQSLQPFVALGGSLVIGTETLSYGINSPVGTYVGYGSESRESLGWYAGGGFNWVLGANFALSALGKYQYAKFGKELVGVKDYSGAQILVGAAYLYH